MFASEQSMNINGAQGPLLVDSKALLSASNDINKITANLISRIGFIDALNGVCLKKDRIRLLSICAKLRQLIVQPLVYF